MKILNSMVIVADTSHPSRWGDMIETEWGFKPLITLLEWHDILNSWDWPEDLPINKPYGFDELENYQKYEDVTFQDATKRVNICMSHKESLSHHNVSNLGKTFEEFLKLWDESASKQDWELFGYRSRD